MRIGALAVLVLVLVLAAPAAAQRFAISTVQSPPNPVPAGQQVTYTTTVTNTDSEQYPQPGLRADDVFLDMFLSRHLTDSATPNNYRSVTPSQGTCTPQPTKPPSVDCTLGTLAPGASATYTSVVDTLVSMDNRISLVHCNTVYDCGTLGIGDADTIVRGCVVPAVKGKTLSAAKSALKAAGCTRRSPAGTRRSASAGTS